MSDRAEQAKSIFLEAIDKYAPDAWPAYLENACAGDAELRGQVEKLLQAQAEIGSFHEEQRVPIEPTVDQALHDLPGTVIGAYKLLEQIGEGGFGVVFMAEQMEPVRRKVALKILKPGMDTKQVLARFDAERQALAIMDHPNIAKVFDGGSTGRRRSGLAAPDDDAAKRAASPTDIDIGRPYFVMELVKGVPITEFCDQNQLTPRQRLELFIPVCQAVQHAHQKGIIHRDLKPSNVLVSRHDSMPVPKVIDFGVAKALGQELTDKTLFTGIAQMIGTPLYMSPEQAGMSDLDIDTRSDIYSLGVLLYELLTGTTPFDKERFKQAAYDEIRRIIREEDPPKPSTRLSDSKDSLPSISAQRHTEPAKLTKLVRGELDWIVMKALEKDRDRRYETANGFAQDLQRYLADEPVQACPPSAGYRLRKFVRRHKGIVLATTVILVLLSGGILGTTIGLVQAEQARFLEAEQRRAAELEREEKEKARQEAVAHLQVARRAIDQMLTRVAIDQAGFEPRRERMWRDLLQDALEFYQELFKGRSDDPKMRQEMGLAFSRLGRAHERLRDLGKAMQTLRQAIDMLEGLAAEAALDPEGREALIASYRHLGWVLSEVGRRDERVAAHRHALQHAEKLVADFPQAPKHQNILGDCCTIMGTGLRPTEARDAEALFRRAIGLLNTPSGNRHNLGTAHLALGELLQEEGRLPESEESLGRAIALFKEVVAGFPHMWQGKDRLSDARLLLGKVLAARGRLDVAEQAIRQAIEIWEQQKAAFPGALRYRDDLIRGYADLGQLLAVTGKADEAKTIVQKLSLMTPENAAACNDLAWLFASCVEPSLRDPARAVKLARNAVDLAPQFANHWRTLGAAQYRDDDEKAAVASLKKSMDLRAGGDGHAWFLLAMVHWKLGQKEAARQWLDQAVAWTEMNQSRNEELRFLRVEAAKLLGIPAKPN